MRVKELNIAFGLNCLHSMFDSRDFMVTILRLIETLHSTHSQPARICRRQRFPRRVRGKFGQQRRRLIALCAIGMSLGLSACDRYEYRCKARSSDLHPDSPRAQSSVACVNPEMIPDATGKDSGFVCCADGSVDRVAVKSYRTGWEDACKTDTDCESDEFCMPGFLGRIVRNTCEKRDNCASASDCPDSKAPACGFSVARSYSTNDSGLYISATLACRTPEDKCRNDDQCDKHAPDVDISTEDADTTMVRCNTPFSFHIAEGSKEAKENNLDMRYQCFKFDSVEFIE